MGQFTLSSYSSNTMARIFVVSLLVALSHAAPSAPVAVSAPLAYGHLGHLGHLGHAHIAAPAVVGTQVHEHVVPGPPVHQTYQEVVGHRTVQVGSQAVQVGHTYAQEKSVSQAPAYTYVAGPPKTSQTTVPIAPPAIPAAPAPYAAIPPAPTNQGPAPADTVTVTKIAAPVRSHTRITPQVTNIVPQVQVHKYDVDVPVAVPRAVPREILVEKPVAKPYEVPVPRAVHVPAPYKVHPVQEIVETPHIHHATVETHSTQAVVTAHATPVHAVSHAPVAAVAAAPVAAATYAAAPALTGAYAAAPAVAATGYAVA